MPAQTTIQSTTQQFLDIYDIVNDLIIMKDGATSLILTVNAINFGLFAEEEQDAVIYAYAGLLNSLNYPIQIVVKSQTKDVTSYLQLLKEQEDQSSPEKRARIQRYREFVGNLIHEGNVLDKKFYVVIPASSLEMGMLPPQTVIPGVKKADITGIDRSQILEKAKNILEPKRDHLISQFGRIGLQARQLATQEIIQLFYTSYNPEAAEGQQLTDTRDYTTSVVSADIQTIPSNLGQSPGEPLAMIGQPVAQLATQAQEGWPAASGAGPVNAAPTEPAAWPTTTAAAPDYSQTPPASTPAGTPVYQLDAQPVQPEQPPQPTMELTPPPAEGYPPAVETMPAAPVLPASDTLPPESAPATPGFDPSAMATTPIPTAPVPAAPAEAELPPPAQL